MNTVLDQQERRTDILATKELAPVPEHRKGPRWRMAALAAAGILATGVVAWKYFAQPAPAGYATAAVRRGDLAKTISATGKVQAVTTVQVGTQVSGTVSELHADFNDQVKAGQIIARLDPSQIQAQLEQAKASLAGAESRVATARSTAAAQEAAVRAAKASVDGAAASLLEATRAYENNQFLVKEGVAARRTLETSEASKLQAAAQKAQAEAQLAQVQAQAAGARSSLEASQAEATQSRAAVQVAQVNLERTIIRAPIDGVVVSRSVDVGQTVAASLQAPVLFLIANDLTKMQVLADIDEADVGQLSPESKVSFTVDAFPSETFTGKISQIRLSPTVVQNVVTYTAVIDVANPKLQLKPGMTATLTARVAERNDVLLVPAAALRFTPTGASATTVTPQPGSRGKDSSSSAGNRGKRTGTGTTPGVIWKATGTALQPVRVRVGMSDGVSTEVISDQLAEGDVIAVPAAQASTQKRTQTTALPGTAPATRAMGGRRF